LFFLRLLKPSLTKPSITTPSPTTPWVPHPLRLTSPFHVRDRVRRKGWVYKVPTLTFIPDTKSGCPILCGPHVRLTHTMDRAAKGGFRNFQPSPFQGSIKFPPCPKDCAAGTEVAISTTSPVVATKENQRVCMPMAGLATCRIRSCLSIPFFIRNELTNFILKPGCDAKSVQALWPWSADLGRNISVSFCGCGNGKLSSSTVGNARRSADCAAV
jgi:hypothetical protein